MMDTTLIDILKLSLDLEKSARQFYQDLSDHTPVEAEKAFWRQMALDEGSHMEYWETLISLAKEKKIQNLFDYPVRVHQELIRVSSFCEALIQDETIFSDTGKSFLTAVRLEFYMLHPAFGAMLHLYEEHIKEGPLPGSDYQRHLQFLMNGVVQFVGQRPEYLLIADMLQMLLQSNQRMSRQLAEVRMLRGLLPICMHCKKIRNEDGFWVSVEKYIAAHSDVEFSHGICEECMEKYYPDFA